MFSGLTKDFAFTTLEESILPRAVSIVCSFELYIIKAYVRYFISNFYISPNDNPSKNMKNVFYFI